MGLEHFIWYEKHRPSELSQLSLRPQYRQSFEQYIAMGEIPHLLLFGPQGSGKTTIAFILLNSIPCVRLILNASSGDRGIETMRTKVKQFASSATIDGRPKFVLMDEADGILRDAQEALRGTIEAYSKTCRFIFTCNAVDRIIGPIQSRCTLFEFSAFPFDAVTQQCEQILIKENVKYDAESIEKVVSQHYPDIRSVINNLQLCSASGTLDPALVSKMVVDPALLIECIGDGNIGKIRSMLLGISNFIPLYQYLFDTLLALDDDQITQDEKTDIAHTLAESLYRDAIVANREIVFVDCMITIMGILKCQSISFNS